MPATHNPHPPTLMSPWRFPLFWILVVGLLAMGSALQADFYMDDFGFILDRNGNAPNTFRLILGGQTFGSVSPEARDITVFQLIPTLMTVLTNWLFPMNSMAAHAWNLLIHLTLSVLVFHLGQRLLGRLKVLSSPEACRHAAIWGALVFACHPLATEPVHYAKCHMVALVALFGFWATCEALEFLAAPARRSGLRCLLATTLCIISYFPGTVMLGINLCVLVVFTLAGKDRGALAHFTPSLSTLRRPRNLAALMMAGAAVLYIAYYFLGAFHKVITSWNDHFLVHVATQGRVFWEYAQRVFLPVHLASDHYQPWSTFRDAESVMKLALFVLLMLGSAFFAFRQGPASRRGLGLLILFALIPFAMRMLYVNIEIMVEYRAYNALPWISLLFGVALSALASRVPNPRLRWLPAGATVMIFTLLSVERGAVWKSSILLAENSMAQYPLNLRARNQLQYFDYHSGHFAEVIQRHDEVLDTLRQISASNALTQRRQYTDTLRANSNVLSSFQLTIYAKAELEGYQAALDFSDRSLAALKTEQPHWFLTTRESPQTTVWPLLEARKNVERAKAQKESRAQSPALP